MSAADAQIFVSCEWCNQNHVLGGERRNVTCCDRMIRLSDVLRAARTANAPKE
jgi:hypothetical protein